MSIDIDAGGALITAALVARELESGKDKDGNTVEHAEQCANCGAVLTGPFCQACGQRAHVHRSLLHLGEEFLHGLLHFDAKAWRTLPLLVFRPGQLTRRYLDGQRTRFVSPLALFLFMMFFMFFVASYTSSTDHVKDFVHTREDLLRQVEQNKTRLAQMEKSLADARAKGLDMGALAEDIEDTRVVISTAEKGLAAMDAKSKKEALKDAKNEGKGDSAGADTDKKRKDDGSATSNEWLNGSTGVESIDKALKAAAANPDLTLYKLKSAASKFTFVLVPISLPFLWLVFFWRRGVTMYDHAVFVLYSLSFMAVLFSTAFLLKFAGLKWIVVWMLFLAPPIHMFAQLRGTYSLGIGGALWRTVFLMLSASLVMLMYLILILVAAVR